MKLRQPRRFHIAYILWTILVVILILEFKKSKHDVPSVSDGDVHAPAERVSDGNVVQKTVPIDLIINILSHPKNFEKRASQRATWIQDVPPNIIYRFVIGNIDYIDWDSPEQRQRFDQEFASFGDLVVFYEAIESYRGISKKTLLAIESSVHLFKTKEPRYIAKTDDDIYVTVKNVEKLIERNQTKYYAGKIKSRHYPHREKTSQWYTSYDEWPDDITPYPDFAAGVFYILSLDIAKEAAKLFRHPDYKLFPYEDVQTGIIMNRLGVNAVPIEVVETSEPSDQMVANHYGGVHTMWRFHERFGKHN